MPRTGRVRRAFVEVQRIITDFFERGIHPTTQQIQSALYGSTYNPDSSIQNKVVYSCITRGRGNVITMWDNYVQGGTFIKDVAYVQYYEDEEMKKQVESEEFSEFHLSLQDGRFGRDTEEIIKSLGQYPAVATIFGRRIREYSKAGNNFVIASYGRESRWFIPSWWIWNIREYNLYRRSLKILRMQLNRGVRTKVLLPSGQPIEKALDYETVVRAALEDKTVWSCPKCKIRNLGIRDNCVICGITKP